MTTNHYRAVLNMVKAQIEALHLDGIMDGMVSIRKSWKGEQDPLTCGAGILIGTNTERHGDGNNEQWEVMYPAVVGLGMGTGGGDDENLDRISEWRQEIHRAFDNKREPQHLYLDDNDVIKDICRVAFNPGWLDDLWKKNWDASLMVIWTTVYIQRFA